VHSYPMARFLSANTRNPHFSVEVEEEIVDLFSKLFPAGYTMAHKFSLFAYLQFTHTLYRYCIFWRTFFLHGLPFFC